MSYWEFFGELWLYCSDDPIIKIRRLKAIKVEKCGKKKETLAIPILMRPMNDRKKKAMSKKIIKKKEREKKLEKFKLWRNF